MTRNKCGQFAIFVMTILLVACHNQKAPASASKVEVQVGNRSIIVDPSKDTTDEIVEKAFSTLVIQSSSSAHPSLEECQETEEYLRAWLSLDGIGQSRLNEDVKATMAGLREQLNEVRRANGEGNVTHDIEGTLLRLQNFPACEMYKQDIEYKMAMVAAAKSLVNADFPDDLKNVSLIKSVHDSVPMAKHMIYEYMLHEIEGDGAIKVPNKELKDKMLAVIRNIL